MSQWPLRTYKLLSNTARRGYAVQAPGAPTLQVFNRHTKWLQKERAAANTETSRRVDYLRDEVANRLVDRLLVRPLRNLMLAALLTTPYRT